MTRERKLLLVDPDARFAKILEGWLEGEGWRVIWMADGRQALSALTSLSPDAVMTELDLPHVDAFELIETIVRRPSPPPVIVCSRAPRVRSWTRRTLADLGIEHAICRPVRLAAIAEALEDVVETRRSREIAARRGAAATPAVPRT